MKKALSLLLVLAMVLALGVGSFASSGEASGETAAVVTTLASEDDPVTAEDAGWLYSYTDDSVVVLQAPQSVKQEMVVLIPAYMAGKTITSLGNGNAVMSNNKLDGSWVLFPEELTYVADSAIHDFNDTIAWVIPDSVDVSDSPWLSCSGYVITGADSPAAAAAALNGKDVVSMDGLSVFTVSAGENGWITPGGTYYVPEEVYGLGTELTVTAGEGYKLASVTVDGKTTEFEDFTQEYTFTYTFSADSAAVSAEFVALAEGETEERSFSAGAGYRVIDLIDGAVAEGFALDEDLYEVQSAETKATDYVHALGVSTGVYYTYGDTLYEEVYSSQASSVEYETKAEVINAMYETNGWVYGEDYDFIRLHNYYAELKSGPSTGTVAMFCTYLYKQVADDFSLDGTTVYSSDNTDHASVFTQGLGEYTINNLTVFCYTGGRGPSECGNFYGVGSQVHVDGGTEGKIATSDIHYDTAVLRLNQPQILGTNNAIYATGRGLAIIQGGDIFACSSGGHGPYVSQGGQIVINCDGTNLINEDGSVNIEDPYACEIPDYSYAAMGQDEDGSNALVLTDHPDDVTVIVSGLDAGTALATDKGGGTIVANRVVTKCYGLRSAGVYTIGYSESWVYVFNSTCTSNLDAALCSASAGYGYAFNCRLQGCMGLKVRASGNTNTEDAGLWVENCRISAYYDAQAEEDAFVVGSPDEFIELVGADAGIEPQGADESYADYLTRADAALYDYIVNQGGSYGSSMNIFIDPANTPHYNEGGITWWYLDRSKTPGYSGGNKFAVIYSDGSPAVVNVDSCLLVNDNYALYGEESEWWNGLTDAEKEIYTPADNLIASAENGGKLNVTFVNENSSTKWDVTGESDETCEINGDFFVGPKSTNAINATLVNSEWTGTVLYADPTSATSGEVGEEAVGEAYIVLSEGSVWNVTEECVINGLTIDSSSTLNGTVVENADGTYTVYPAEAGVEGSAEGTVTVTVFGQDFTFDSVDINGESYLKVSDILGKVGVETSATVGAPAEEEAPAAEMSESDLFYAYIDYLREYVNGITDYESVGDGGFDSGAAEMALGELDTVAYGDDVNEFPIEMFVSQFGADSYDVWVAGYAG